MIRIEVFGSWSARCGALIVDRESARRGSPICEIARLLIAKGRHEWEPCQVWRGDTLVFDAHPIGKWAARYAAEPDGAPHSVRMRNYRTPPDQVNGSKSAQKEYA